MLKLQIGAGFDGPARRPDIDASPTVPLQRMRVAGTLFQRRRDLFGNVLRGSSPAADRTRSACSPRVRRRPSFEACQNETPRTASRQSARGPLQTALGDGQDLSRRDYRSIDWRLTEAGLPDIRSAAFNDSAESAGAEAEDVLRREGCLGSACRKHA